ncbi:MAG TPA: HAD-IA family hydrolase [Gemmatimonadaceae bacterium]
MSTSLSCTAILFDLDGVLVDSRGVVERTWRRWAERHHVREPELVRRAHGRRSVETVREVTPHLDATREVEWLAQAELADLEGVIALPGAVAMLNVLAGGEWAVVTSGGRELARRRLAHCGLATPGVLVAAEDVLSGKPSPEGYLLAAKRLGVDASECVVVEDTPAGIESGRSARAKVVALTTTFSALALTAADVVISSLADLSVQRAHRGLRLSVPGRS